jgi:hypothetical protein
VYTGSSNGYLVIYDLQGNIIESKKISKHPISLDTYTHDPEHYIMFSDYNNKLYNVAKGNVYGMSTVNKIVSPVNIAFVMLDLSWGHELLLVGESKQIFLESISTGESFIRITIDDVEDGKWKSEGYTLKVVSPVNCEELTISGYKKDYSDLELFFSVQKYEKDQRGPLFRYKGGNISRVKDNYKKDIITEPFIINKRWLITIDTDEEVCSIYKVEKKSDEVTFSHKEEIKLEDDGNLYPTFCLRGNILCIKNTESIIRTIDIEGKSEKDGIESVGDGPISVFNVDKNGFSVCYTNYKFPKCKNDFNKLGWYTSTDIKFKHFGEEEKNVIEFDTNPKEQVAAGIPRYFK